MKRGHRKFQRRAWLLLAPLLAAVIGLALLWRSAEPRNTGLPAVLVAPAAGQGG